MCAGCCLQRGGQPGSSLWIGVGPPLTFYQQLQHANQTIRRQKAGEGRTKLRAVLQPEAVSLVSATPL